jgi:hypothetical protein
MRQLAQLRLLRWVLFFCSFVWGISLVGVFLGWNSAAHILESLGAKPLSYDPMLDYWLRMAAGAFALIGVGFLIAALNPRKHLSVLPCLGWLMITEGVILAVHGVRLHLPPFPFYGDVAACFTGGLGILSLRKSAGAQTF